MSFLKLTSKRLISLCSIIFIMSFAISQEWINGININPTNPTIEDEISISVYGITPSNLIEVNSTFEMGGVFNQISLLLDVYVGNEDVVEYFESTTEIGSLQLGSYSLEVLARYYQFTENGNAELLFTDTGYEYFNVVDPEPLTGLFGNVWTTNDWGIEIPVPGATIEATLHNDESEPVFSTTTNETGHYELQLEHGFYMVTCSKEGFISQTVPIEIGNASVQMDFMLQHQQETVWISGTVFGTGGYDPDDPSEPSPLSGSLVELLGLLNGEWTYIWETETNNMGYYEVPIMELPAIYEGLALKASAEEYEPQLQEITFDDIEYPITMDFYLEPILEFEAHLMGHVYSVSDDANNTFPIGEAHVEIFSDETSDIYADTYTNETGYYEFGEIAGSATWIRVSALGYITQETEIPLVDCNSARCWPITMDFYLEPNQEDFVHLFGQVGSYSENGDVIPIEGAYIAVPQAGNAFIGITNEEGFYEMEFPWLWNGPITIICEAEGYYAQSVTVFPEDNSLEIEQNFILEPYQEGNGVLAGFVTAQTSPSGPVFPVAGAVIGATPTWGPEPWYQTETNEIGYYELELWANQAPWQVFCNSDYGQQEEFAVIQANQTTELSFHYNAWEPTFPPPYDLTATIVENNYAVHLQWFYDYDFPGSELMSFNVYANLGDDSNIPWVLIGTTNETHFVHPLMNPGEDINGEICYKVTAVDSITGTETEPSNVACVNLDPPEIPTPHDLTAEYDPENGSMYGSAILDWEYDFSSEDQFVLFTIYLYYGYNDLGWMAVGETHETHYTHIFGDFIPPPQESCFKVTATINGIESSASNEACVWVEPPPEYSVLFGHVTGGSCWECDDWHDLQGATVTAYTENSDVVYVTETDEAGNYELDLAPGFYSVTASHTGFPSHTENIYIEPNTENELNFILIIDDFEFTDLFGTVVWQTPNGENQPISGAHIIAYPDSVNSGFETYSNDNGHYAMEVTANTHYFVVCSFSTPVMEWTQTQEIYVGHEPAELNFVFGEEPQFGLLTGNVRTACDIPEWWECPPIFGAIVHIHNPMFEAEVLTDSIGFFEIMLPPAGGYSSYQLHVMADGFVDYYYPDLIEIYPGEETHVDINLTPFSGNDGSLVGHVYEENTDFPVGGIEVNLYGEDNWCGYYTVTDENGYYFFNDVCSGLYTLKIFAEGYEDYEHEHIMIYPGEETNFDVFLNPISDIPDWEVDIPAYEFNMAFAGLLYFDGEESFDENDLLGAFVGDECRGLAQPTFFPLTERYTVNLMIYSNLTEGEIVSFKAFDYSENIVFENVTESLEFQADGIVGNDLEPFEVHAVSTLTMTIDFIEGWNWFSINLFGDDMSLNTVLASLGDNASFIKNQDGYANYYDDFGWYGLETFNELSMYMILVNNFSEFIFNGYPIDLGDNYIPLSEGWNWISYLPQYSLDINVALSSIEPNGIFIKNQFAYANYYDDFGWYGFEIMEPSNGYMLLMEDEDQLAYTVPVPVLDLPKESSLDFERWNVNPHKFEYNMALTCSVPEYGNFVIATFSGNEIRGVAQPTYFPPNMNNTVNLTVYGNSTGEELTFKLLDENTFEVLDILETIEFEVNGIIGDDFDPILLRVAPETPSDFVLHQNYPNPFNPTTTISYYLPTDSEVSVIVYDVQGRVITSLVESAHQTTGYQSTVWDANGFSSGLYIVSVESERYSSTQKVLLMK